MASPSSIKEGGHRLLTHPPPLHRCPPALLTMKTAQLAFVLTAAFAALSLAHPADVQPTTVEGECVHGPARGIADSILHATVATTTIDAKDGASGRACRDAESVSHSLF